MEYRKIAGSDLSVSRLVLGTMMFGSQVERSEAARIVGVARDAGVTLFDTANTYNKGESERILGEIVKPYRDEVLLATKVRAKMGDGPDDAGLSAGAIRKQLDESLRRLQTDRVDLYFLHRPDPNVPIEESLGVMSSLVEAGKVRHIGVSNYAAWHITEMRRIQERNGLHPVAVVQNLYNVLSRRLDEEYAACARHLGLFTFAFSPLAGGVLSGKYRSVQSRDWAKGGVFDGKQLYRDRYWGKQQFQAVRELEEVAADDGLSLLELAFRWLLARDFVGAVILGASTATQLSANLAAASGPAPSSDAMARCEAVWVENLRGSAPNYNREDTEGGKLP